MPSAQPQAILRRLNNGLLNFALGELWLFQIMALRLRQKQRLQQRQLELLRRQVQRAVAATVDTNHGMLRCAMDIYLANI